ncbi:hypothetical protein [Bacillus thuringiensis]|uniref:hypothetical protein n=1 Tax=Bacillus thuringiensis TaxID=1428 RepID=UPI000BFB26CD|nr:hypothetical protein [Bacillus thuringiensis]PGM47121.1 hypothetical protein CN949_26785 [Bacillus thuringiensis]
MNIPNNIKIYKEYKGGYVSKGEELYELSEEVLSLINIITTKKNLSYEDFPEYIRAILNELMEIGILEREMESEKLSNYICTTE